MGGGTSKFPEAHPYPDQSWVPPRDLNAAFDTTDHGILIDRRLKSRFGINGAALQWFKAYLKDRSTRVMINNVMSQQHILNSVPHGSILGPQGFTIYTHPVGDIIRAHNICFHTYADDTQLLCDFNPKIPGDCKKEPLVCLHPACPK